MPILNDIGPLPQWADELLGNCTLDELERIDHRLIESASLDELFSGLK